MIQVHSGWGLTQPDLGRGFQNSVAKFMKQAGFSSPLLLCPRVQTFAWWLHGNRDATMEYSSQGARRNPSVELCSIRSE